MLSKLCIVDNGVVWYGKTLHWRDNDHGGVSNHQPHGCLLNRLFGRRSKKTSKLRVTGLCVGNSPETDEFPTQMASNAENGSIWWRHHETKTTNTKGPMCLTIGTYHSLEQKLVETKPFTAIEINELRDYAHTDINGISENMTTLWLNINSSNCMM